MSNNEGSTGASGKSMDNKDGEGDMRNPDSEPEVEDQEKEVDGEFGKVEVLDTEREKTTDLDFQHCKIPKYTFWKMIQTFRGGFSFWVKIESGAGYL